MAIPNDSCIAGVLTARNRRIAIVIDGDMKIPQDKKTEEEINKNKDNPAVFIPGKDGLTLNGESYEGLHFLYSDGFLRSIGDELGGIIFTRPEKRNPAFVVSQLESIIIECFIHELRHEFQFFEKSKNLLNLNNLGSFLNPKEEQMMIQEWNSLCNLYEENIEIELDAFIVGNFAKSIWQKKLTREQKLDMIKNFFYEDI